MRGEKGLPSEGNDLGKVFLVGAGPGDPGLITVKGRLLLQEADVVVYDRLSSRELLRVCREGAELIYAGKRPGEHTFSQEEINRLLIERARQGLKVVRLKGGDPFVFGRGAEEALALADAGVPFEIVPGVSAAVAVPGYAGIPLTHRGIACSFAVVTGHEEPSKAGSAVNWGKLAGSVDTLVVLMPVKNMEVITRGLMDGGMDGDMPAAVVAWGTTSRQRVITAPLREVSSQVRAYGIRHPATLIIGEVVRLRERLTWFENRPLFGRRVLVTRAPGQTAGLSSHITALGGEPVEIPLIKIVPPDDWAPVDKAIRRLGDYHWVIFASANAVEFFMERLRALGLDSRAFAACHIASVGEATALALDRHGLRADVTPRDFRAESLLLELEGRVMPGQRVLLPRGDIAREVLAEGLAGKGAAVEPVVVYCNRPAKENGDALRELLSKKQIDAITFASPSAVDNFLDVLGECERFVLEGVVVACVGPTTADHARGRGLRVDVMPERYTMPELARALAAHFARLSQGRMA